jgi:hypothetical protein
MQANYNVAVGTPISFGPSSRLRKIEVDQRTKVSRFKEHGMQEGVLIGEGKQAKIVARIEEQKTIAYVVELESGHFGWCYNFEFHIL